jgi:hypothetical protein
MNLSGILEAFENYLKGCGYELGDSHVVLASTEKPCTVKEDLV